MDVVKETMAACWAENPDLRFVMMIITMIDDNESIDDAHPDQVKSIMLRTFLMTNMIDFSLKISGLTSR